VDQRQRPRVVGSARAGCRRLTSDMPERDWPFDQPRNAASITLRSIVFAGAPILHVTHDEDDHGWQFLGMEDAREDDACVVGLQEIVAKDPSLLELADLPPGWPLERVSLAARAQPP
jgi:hypothetical protein